MSERLFCYYGDDFTGSTDVLEVLAANGVPCTLFFDPPGESELARFPNCRAIGVAGESRSRDPEWMDAHLPAVFSALRGYAAPICQYKVCSTFDSSPEWGSIGRALEIGRSEFAVPFVPVVAAAPHLGRYVLFGNLFAEGGGAVHRIDRHPTMSRHPVTPMPEADLRLHLAKQTATRIALMDLNALLGGRAAERYSALLRQQPGAILFDGLNDKTALETGRLLWTAPGSAHSFAVGSSGLTLALIHYWREAGMIPHDVPRATVPPAERLIVVSGSCSPVTEGQIRWALSSGFSGVRLDASQPDRDAATLHGLAALNEGKSLVVYSALGPGDRTAGAGGESLGRALGEILTRLLEGSGVRRVLLAGGDTATHALRRQGISALTFLASTVPGAPLCRAHSAMRISDGLELVLKGGQIGPENYFEMVRKGNL